ncbi:DUF262 domain-containing HNH endonuclease family protein [Dietzia maris]|uniref:DUF262 domain-containing HNH endonuclease family protein n=1 Tax=Dietzia maris TaxID=37915 RepID=A0AAE4QXL1_9ACTN|nr:DUF262 domain-containing protein [Dietzia maris]MDV6298524.1 DUF262 domain-containing HNH endonuclease family protein [Dietzia maris]
MTIDADPDLNEPVALTVSAVFDAARYVVPLYQRAYAWTPTEVETLLKDVRDARTRSIDGGPRRNDADYYIGSLVVDTVRSDGEVVHEVVDGQQRLTTLLIILSVAARELGAAEGPAPENLQSVLGFEGRPEAEKDLRLLCREGPYAIERVHTAGIRVAAETVKRACAATVDDSAFDDTVRFTRDDFDYLQAHVRLLRTSLPAGTDLNHYFEVMNTRGEQLEKHEILKARMAHSLPTQEQTAFAHIWDACSVLDRHLQVQFPADDRVLIFGADWDGWVNPSAGSLFANLTGALEATAEAPIRDTPLAPSNDPQGLALIDVLRSPPGRDDAGNSGASDDDTGSYGTIVDFPNLLLHVLKLYRVQPPAWSAADAVSSVSLMDKNLLEEFEKFGPRPERPSEVRHFAWLLLKARFLLDTYVIRTQGTAGRDDDENWVLHRARRSNTKITTLSTFGGDSGSGGDPSLQRRILLLQSMFQVTDTRRTGKNFLYNILHWLNSQEHGTRIDGHEFARRLEDMARDRLATIYSPTAPKLLHRGTQVQNYIFNFLDYELFRFASERRGGAASGTEPSPFSGLADRDLTDAVRDFRFRFRTSVEHFYPVNPDQSEGHEKLPHDVCDHFGNLCLLTRSENSTRSNLMPKPKVGQFDLSRQTLKFQIMAKIAEKSTWGEAEIRAHGDAMTSILDSALEARDAG